MAKRRTTSTTALLRVGLPSTALGAAPLPVDGKGVRLKLVSWGKDDNLPQDCVRIVYDSGTAEACVERLSQFIGGEGFASESTANFRANDEQTLGELLDEAKDYAGFGFGVVLVVRYTYGGQRGDVFVEPADCTRPAKEGGYYVVNYGLAEGKRAAGDNRVYLPYNPRATEEEIAAEVLAAVESEAGYWGHLVWSFGKKVARTQCPVPSYYSGKEDIENDAALAKYDFKQSNSGFFPDAVMTVVGSKYNAEADPDFVPGPGQTDNDAPDVESPDLTDVKKSVKALKGAQSDSSVLLLTAESKEELPQLDFIDKGPNSKGLTDGRNRIVSAVCRHMGVPPVLIGVAEAGMLGNNQQIINSIKLFNLTVGPRRRQIIAPLKKLFPEITDWTVKPLNPVDYIDPAVAAKMTEDEIRAFGGLPALEKPQSTEAQRTLQALAGLDPVTRQQVLADMTEDERRALIGLAPVQAPKPRPKA